MKRLALTLCLLFAMSAVAHARKVDEVHCNDRGCITVKVEAKNYGKYLRSASGKRVRIARVERGRYPLLDLCTLPVNFAKLTLEKIQTHMLVGITGTLINAEKAFHFFVDAGYNTFAAAGIVGHIKAESNFSIKATGDRGKARGIAQWHPDRFRKMKAWAQSKGKDWHSYRTQLEYIDVELRSRERLAFEGLQRAQSVKEATIAFMHFERPQGYTPDRPARGHSYGKRYAFAALAHDRFVRDLSAASRGTETGDQKIADEGWNIHKSVAPATLLLGFAIFLGAGALRRG